MDKPVFVFISPHLDDAALSCGGRIRRLANAGERVLLLSIFASDLPAGQPLSWLMRSNHIRWSAGDSPFCLRRMEDAAAARVLGAEYAHMDLLDAMYRRSSTGQPFYQKDTVLVPVDTGDQEKTSPILRQKLAEQIARLEASEIHLFCPLGIGEHVDHLLTRYAVEQIAGSYHLSYYEEFPYVTRPNAFEHWQMSHRELMDSLVQEMVALSEEEIIARIEATACYTTQIPFLFPTTWQAWLGLFQVYIPGFARFFPVKNTPEEGIRRISNTLRDYLTRSGGERYWSHKLTAGDSERRDNASTGGGKDR
jgi:LmbE family N-acetylglucosaminyl deacetylase